MHRTTLIAALSALALLPALATPAAAEETVTLNVGVDGESYAFVVEGMTGTNPAIELPAESTVTVTFTNNGTTVHNLVFGTPIGKGTQILEPGGTETITFTVPANANGTTTYYCEPHQFQGMEGQVAFKADEDPTPTTPDPTQEVGGDDEGGRNGIPGPGAIGVLVGAIGAAALSGFRRRA